MTDSNQSTDLLGAQHGTYAHIMVLKLILYLHSLKDTSARGQWTSHCNNVWH